MSACLRASRKKRRTHREEGWRSTSSQDLGLVGVPSQLHGLSRPTRWRLWRRAVDASFLTLRGTTDVSVDYQTALLRSKLTRFGRECLSDAGFTAQQHRQSLTVAADYIVEAAAVSFELLLSKGADGILVAFNEHESVKGDLVPLNLFDTIDIQFSCGGGKVSTLYWGFKEAREYPPHSLDARQNPETTGLQSIRCFGVSARSISPPISAS